MVAVVEAAGTYWPAVIPTEATVPARGLVRVAAASLCWASTKEASSESIAAWSLASWAGVSVDAAGAPWDVGWVLPAPADDGWARSAAARACARAPSAAARAFCTVAILTSSASARLSAAAQAWLDEPAPALALPAVVVVGSAVVVVVVVGSVVVVEVVVVVVVVVGSAVVVVV